VFPPSDSNSLEQSNENLNGNGARTASADEPRTGELIPFGGMAPAGVWPYGYPSRPEILSAKPNILNLLHCLRRRKWLALFLGLVLGGGSAAAAWVVLQTRYESSAFLQVHANPPSVFKDESGNALDFKTFKEMQVAAIKSEPVADVALASPTIADSPIVKKWYKGVDGALSLAHDLIVEPGNGELVKVSLRDVDPKSLSDIVNAVITAYAHEVIDKEDSDKRSRRQNLETQVNSLNQKQLEKKRQLDELSRQFGTSDSEFVRQKKRIEQDKLEALMRSRTDTEGKISDLELRIKMVDVLMQNLDRNNPPDEDVEDYASKDPRIQQAVNEVSTYQHQLTELQKVMKSPNAPEIVRMRDAINSVQRTIEEMKNEDRQAVANALRRNNGATSTSMQQMKLERELLAARLKEIVAKIDMQADNIQKLEKFNGDVDQLRDDIEERKIALASLTNELTLRNVEVVAESRIKVAGTATTPVPVQPWRQVVGTVIAGIFGFGLAVFGVIFFEFMSRKLTAAHELTDGLGIRVMGDLPALRRRIGLRSRSRRAMHGLVAESINSIRATLVRNATPGSSNVFLVTSAGESEGKTTVASQLAASLARGGRKTLLIDGDLRHPGAHLVFGLPNEQGFSELLRGEVDVDEVIQPTPADNLWMVTAGQCCATAVMAMGKEAVAQVLGRLEARFEFIVIDTGPVLKVADALLLGAHVDGAILSVLRDVSRIHKVYEANERLKLAGVKVVGAVVNGIEGRGSFDRYHVEMSAA